MEKTTTPMQSNLLGLFHRCFFLLLDISPVIDGRFLLESTNNGQLRLISNDIREKYCVIEGLKGKGAIHLGQ